MDALLKRHVDDYKAIDVTTYKAMRKHHFAHLNEDLSFLDGYETMVLMALSYPKSRVKYKGKGYGYVSRYAHGSDYHTIFRRKLKTITDALASRGYKTWADADISPVDERFAAYLSGLGYIGHNRFLIHPSFGTHLYLAVMLIDAPLKTTAYALDSCADCTRCIDACPTDALEKGGYHVERCLSQRTQVKRSLDIEEIRSIDHYVFGCDICQIVCPKNRAITPVHRSAFLSDDAAQLHLKTLLSMSNKQFQKHYGHYAFAWRGASILKRNALAILFNQKDPEVFDYARRIKATYPDTHWLKATIQTLLNEEKS